MQTLFTRAGFGTASQEIEFYCSCLLDSSAYGCYYWFVEYFFWFSQEHGLPCVFSVLNQTLLHCNFYKQPWFCCQVPAVSTGNGLSGISVLGMRLLQQCLGGVIKGFRVAAKGLMSRAGLRTVRAAWHTQNWVHTLQAPEGTNCDLKTSWLLKSRPLCIFIL